jgi:hypothetical protein
VKAAIQILFLFLSPLFLPGQDFRFDVSGSVTDRKTGEPLTNVNIESQNNKTGTITDESGYFEISLSAFPTSLTFSHIGYSSLKINLEVPPIGKINVQLTREATQLSGVTVITGRIDTIYRDSKYSVLDYELLDDGILLLIFKYTLSRAELLFRTYDGRDKAGLAILPGRPLQLFRDCLGNVHMFTKTRSFQIYFEGDNIKLMPGVDIDEFKEIMGDCIFRAGDNLYFQKRSFHDLVLNYYSVDTASKNWTLFRTVFDKDKMAFLNRNAVSFPGENLNLISAFPGDKDGSIWREYRNIEVQNRFTKMVYLAPVYAPMQRFGDTICIFNHPDSVIEFYDLSNTLLFTTPIKYHITKKYDPLRTFASVWAKSVKWDKSVIIDEQKRKLYTLFIRNNGQKELREIDIGTGETKLVLKIPFPYVEKIKVRDGYAYFIYKGWAETEKKKLFRQLIF